MHNKKRHLPLCIAVGVYISLLIHFFLLTVGKLSGDFLFICFCTVFGRCIKLQGAELNRFSNCRSQPDFWWVAGPILPGSRKPFWAMMCPRMPCGFPIVSACDLRCRLGRTPEWLLALHFGAGPIRYKASGAWCDRCGLGQYGKIVHIDNVRIVHIDKNNAVTIN